MSDLKKALEIRFGEHRVMEVPTSEGEMPLLALDLESRSQVTVILTNGLSDYKMPVPEKINDRAFNELCFCLPSYWEWEDVDNPTMNWIFPWIQKLAKYVVEKETWFGHGHTIPSGKDLPPFSQTMKQNYLILADPILLENELKPLKVADKTIHFLTIIPIFEDEMDMKQEKGVFKFFKKFMDKGGTELLDDYRSSTLKSKWRLF
ncbi:MAG: suppressor of fused domain protein [Crocinitomicaceae bacterium]|nr:suppressor of fused domain protein [Crocinitomicaceae bacterium]